MPKVQAYEQQVRPTALNAPMQRAMRLDSRGAFGEAIGQGLSDFSASMERIQDEDDKAVVKERIAEYRKKSRERLYGDQDAFYTRQGRGAYDSRVDMQDELSKHRDELAKGLTGRQQRMFNDLSQQYLDRDFDGITKHAQKGRVTWLNDQDEAQLFQAQQDMALYWNEVEPYSTQIKKTIDNMAVRNGWPPERKEVELEKALSAGHLSAIENIAVDNPKGAEAYFEKYKGEISPSMWDDIEKKLEQKGNDQQAMQIADAIRVAGGTRSERQAKVNDIQDPDLRKLVRSQVEHDLAQERTAKNESSTDAYDEALKAITGDGRTPGMSSQQWRMQNPEQWDALTGTQQAALMKGSTDGGKTDIAAYWELKGLMLQDRDKAMEYFASNVSKFSNTDAKKIIDGFAKPPKGADNVMNNYQAFNLLMEQLYGKQPAKGDSRKEWNKHRNILMGMYQDDLNEWHENNPNQKQIPDEERRKILDKYLIEKTRKDTFMGIDFLNPDNEVSLSDIPAKDLAGIKQALEIQGVPATPENIVKIWISDR